MKIILPALIAQAAAHGYLSIPMGYRTGQWTGDQSLTDGEDRSWYINKVTCPGYENEEFVMVPDPDHPNCTDGPQPALKGDDEGHPSHCPRQARIKSPCAQKFGNGDDGRNLLEKFGGDKKKYPVYKWGLGEDQKVAWSLAGYHGGYNSYALIPESEVGMDDGRNGKTSKAFDSNVLELANNNVCYKQSKDGECKEKRTAEVLDGKFIEDGETKKGGGFKPEQYGKKTIGVETTVKVPADKYPPGRYVMQWEWDCKKTAQIWQMCVDVEIVGGPVPTPKPTPEPTPEPTPSPSAQCSYLQDHGAADKNTVSKHDNIGTKEECCDLCIQNEQCTHFAHTKGNKCNLKAGDFEINDMPGFVAGVVQRAVVA